MWQKRFREVDRKKIVQVAKNSLWSKEGEKALEYLRFKRGFSDDIIKEFDFGYCPLNINHQLRGRLITPIYDSHKQLVALSTRHLDESVDNRFWHESFDKSSYVYALCYAKKSIMKYHKVIIVEGEFDVAYLHTVGFKMVVSICGSALTLSQTVLLSRYCREMYLAFDGDKQGQIAIERSLKLFKKHNLGAYGIKFIPVKFPIDTDPDEFVKKEKKEAFRKLLIESRSEYELYN